MDIFKIYKAFFTFWILIFAIMYLTRCKSSPNSIQENLAIETKTTITKSEFDAGIDIATMFTDAGIFASKGDAKKMIMSGGVSVNRKKIEDPKLIPTAEMLLHNKFLLVQKGKKNYYLFEIAY